MGNTSSNINDLFTEQKKTDTKKSTTKTDISSSPATPYIPFISETPKNVKNDPATILNETRLLGDFAKVTKAVNKNKTAITDSVTDLSKGVTKGLNGLTQDIGGVTKDIGKVSADVKGIGKDISSITKTLSGTASDLAKGQRQIVGELQDTTAQTIGLIGETAQVTQGQLAGIQSSIDALQKNTVSGVGSVVNTASNGLMMPLIIGGAVVGVFILSQNKTT